MLQGTSGIYDFQNALWTLELCLPFTFPSMAVKPGFPPLELDERGLLWKEDGSQCDTTGLSDCRVHL